MKRILIIGGAGFIGCNLAHYFVNKGREVTVLDNFSRQGTQRNIEWLKSTISSTLRVVHGDIRFDQEKLQKEISKSDVVYHLAAQVAVTTSIENPREDFEINALGTFNVLEALRLSSRRPPFIFSSTNKVYGGMKDIKVTEANNGYRFIECPLGIPETRPLDFYSPYGCSKGAADQYVRDYSRIYDLPTVVFRQSCIYGPNQFGMEEQGWVAHFIISSVLRRPITIYGNGKQVRDILYVEDLCEAFEKAVLNIDKTAGQIYNIGGGPENQMSLLELIDFLERLRGHKIRYSLDKWRPGDQYVFVCDISKARKDFDWHPRVDKESGVKKVHQWVESNHELFIDFYAALDK